MSIIDGLRRGVLQGLGVVSLACPAVGQVSWQENLHKICDQPMPLIELLRARRLRGDLEAAGEVIVEALADRDIVVDRRADDERVRVGAKEIAVGKVDQALHLGDERGEMWVDVLAFASEADAQKFTTQAQQGHSGRDGGDGYLTFLTVRAPAGMDAVSIFVRHGRVVISVGVGLPFKLRPPSESLDPGELAVVDAKIDLTCELLHAVAQGVIDPGEITWIPPAHPSGEDERWMRMAAFARLWSEVKYSFVYLDQRPELDWDRMLERYLPRVAAAQSQAEYVRVLEEAIALLRDGHTNVYGSQVGAPMDSVPIRFALVDGVPIIAELGTGASLRASGLKPGMELVSVGDVPLAKLLADARTRVAASTPQDRDLRACEELLRGPAAGKIHATFLDRDGSERAVDLVCDANSNGFDVPWWHRPVVEFRELGDGLVYLALNTFNDPAVVAEFDKHFDAVLRARGVILDVRNNGGGSSGNGYDIIARLIERPCQDTSVWRTRVYNPTLRAWGRSTPWYEGDHEAIVPRGEHPYLGPVVVLVGPRTFSAAEDFLVPLVASGRAKLVGAPSGGSTGQPLSIDLYGAQARICTKWDRFPDGREFVGVGVPPDVLVLPTRDDLAEGRDPVLARAISLLKDSPGGGGR
jgi:C-terminal processing protease CtpA/Prc